MKININAISKPSPLFVLSVCLCVHVLTNSQPVALNVALEGPWHARNTDDQRLYKKKSVMQSFIA